jgi:very-short-patch-repair endonuclease
MASAVERAVADLGARRHGIVRGDLLDDVRDWEMAELRRRGIAVPLGRGVDRLRDHPFDFSSRCRAAIDLAEPGAVLGLRTAARLHGCYSYRNVDVVEVLVPRGGDHRNALARTVETRSLPAAHVTEIDGLPVTTLARTFFDLCGDPDGGMSVRHPAHRKRMARLYNDAVARRGLTFTQEAAVLLVLAKRGRSGTRLVRELLLEFGPSYKPTRSDTESLFVEFIHAYGLPEPERQVVIDDGHGFIVTVDFAWRSAWLVVEIDSSWHDGPLDEAADEERDRRLRAAGYTVLRFRYGDLIGRPAAVARQLAVATRDIPT